MKLADRYSWLPFLRDSDGLTGYEKRLRERLNKLTRADRERMRHTAHEIRSDRRERDRIAGELARGFANLPRMELHVDDAGKKILARWVREGK